MVPAFIFSGGSDGVGVITSGAIPFLGKVTRPVTRMGCLASGRFAPRGMRSTSVLVMQDVSGYAHRLLRKDQIGLVADTAVNFSRVSAQCYSGTNVA